MCEEILLFDDINFYCHFLKDTDIEKVLLSNNGIFSDE